MGHSVVYEGNMSKCIFYKYISAKEDLAPELHEVYAGLFGIGEIEDWKTYVKENARLESRALLCIRGLNPRSAPIRHLEMLTSDP